MDRDSITRTGARAPGVERWIRSHGGACKRIISDTEQGITDGSQEHEGRRQTSALGRPRLIVRPWSRTGENPPYGILGRTVETSASFEARYAPPSYPTVGYGVVNVGAAGTFVVRKPGVVCKNVYAPNSNLR